MKRVSGFDFKDVKNGEVTDENNDPAPPEVVEVLQKAGIVSFNCNHLDWNVVRRDAEALAERLGVNIQSQ